jgi:hypothetical protein
VNPEPPQRVSHENRWISRDCSLRVNPHLIHQDKPLRPPVIPLTSCRPRSAQPG